MFAEIYKQNETQIKVEIFYNNGKTFLKHWFKMNPNNILIQKYEEVSCTNYIKEA